MQAQRANPLDFRWRSWLGVAVALFLLYGGVNVLAAVFVPLSVHLNGPGPGGTLILGTEIDDALLGRSAAQIGAHDARLAAFLVSLMDTMCAFMLAYAVVYLAVAWFALRRAQPWALGALGLGGLAWLPHYVVVGVTYAGFGAPPSLGDVAPFLGFVVPVLVAAALGWRGLEASRTG